MEVKGAQHKGRTEIFQAASQEQGRPPAGRSRPVSSSAGRGEEVGSLSAPRAELIPRPQLPLYIPDGGWGFPGRTLGGVWVSSRLEDLNLQGPAARFWKMRSTWSNLLSSRTFSVRFKMAAGEQELVGAA